MRYFIIPLLLLTNACAFDPLDRGSLSSFKIFSQDSFAMSAYGRSKEDSWAGSSPQAHKRWIGQYLKKNNMCPQGYSITDVTKTPTGNSSAHYMYRGTCNAQSYSPGMPMAPRL